MRPPRINKAHLGDGAAVPVETVVEMACRSSILPAVFKTPTQPLWAGRAKRLATPARRAVLVARDGGCVGCETPAEWCQARHITHWSAGGSTDIDNLCLLCSRCHHKVHDDGRRLQRETDGRFTLQAPAAAQNGRPPPTDPRRDRSYHRRSARVLL